MGSGLSMLRLNSCSEWHLGVPFTEGCPQTTNELSLVRLSANKGLLPNLKSQACDPAFKTTEN
jgi:hypothetical protein